MTKAEERKALDRIRKIVAECGADSYIGIALDGALELADRNIEEDAAYSCRWYMEKYFDREADARKIKETTDQAIADAQQEARGANEDAAEWQKIAKENKEEMFRLDNLLTESRRETATNAARVQELEQEILKLKAMLFDYMVAERK